MDSQATYTTRENLADRIGEVFVFAAFLVSLATLMVLPSGQSSLALVAHFLCNTLLLVCVANRRIQDRLPLYWSHLDGAIWVFFSYLVVSVYYSEVRGVSWRAAAFQADALLLYFAGRIYFYRRVTLYVAALAAILGIVFLCCYLHQVVGLHIPIVSNMSPTQIGQLTRIATIFGVFWLLTLAFLSIPRPDNVVIFVYVGLVLALGLATAWQRLGWLLGSTRLEQVYADRHQQILTAVTVGRIVKSYPFVGGGLGTLPILYEAFRQSPFATLAGSFSGYMVVAAETGVVGLILLVYAWVRPPLFLLRRWGLFPNVRLRLAVVAFFSFAVLVVCMAVFDSDLLSPGPYAMVWCSYGVLISLIMVRDPGRVFARRLVQAAAAPARGDYGTPVRGKTWPGWVLRIALLLVVFVAQALPYVATSLGHQRATESAESPDYGRRLAKAVQLFPLQADTWARLADHIQARAGNASSLDIQSFLQVEAAYKRAIALNPYEPRYYERLAFLYGDTSNPTMARDTLKHGVRNNPNDLVLRLLLVRELEKAGSLAMSTYHLKHAVQRIAPDQTDLYLRLAELYDRQGLREHAIRYYQYASQSASEGAQVAARLKRLRERLRLPAR